jgi:hypothetical protein
MNTKVIIGVAVIVVVAALILVLALLDTRIRCEGSGDCAGECEGCICVDGFCEPLLNESQVWDIADDKYPDLDKEVYFDENCSSDGCWVIGVDDENESVAGGGGSNVIIHPTSGQVIDVIIRCEPSFTEESWNGSVKTEEWYYNYGCENPKPKCDINHGICRTCASKQDCLKKKIIFITIGSDTTATYQYEIVGGNIVGYYDDVNQMCRILRGGDEIYNQSTSTVDDCVNTILSYVSCVGGECRTS